MDINSTDPAPVAAADAPTSAPPKPIPATSKVEAFARAAHTLYCERYGHVDYASFEDEWLAAAKLIQEFGTEPRKFFDAIASGRAWMDPEDLGSPTGADRFRIYAKEKDEEILNSFVYVEKQAWPQIIRSTDSWETPWCMLANIYVGYSAIFRVAATIACCTDPKYAQTVYEIYGSRARRELLASPLLQRYLVEKWGMNLKALLSLLELYPELYPDTLENAEERKGGNQ